MLDSECSGYKEAALDEVVSTCGPVNIYCHDCACQLDKRFTGKVGSCILDAFHAMAHKCDKKKYDPRHTANVHKMKGLNAQAAEQLWSIMDRFLFATNMGRSNYRAFFRHYCIWRNKFVRGQALGMHWVDVSRVPWRQARAQGKIIFKRPARIVKKPSAKR